MKQYFEITLINAIFLVLSLITQVQAHTEEAGPVFGLVHYFAVIILVSLIVAFGLYLLRHFETVPGSLPVKKLSIAAFVTIILNSLLLGYIYRDVLL